MGDKNKGRQHERWAHLRFSIVGPLLAAPPGRGHLLKEMRRLATKEWIHPITGQPRRFSFSTIERWYYAAREAGTDPVSALRRRLRSDSGQCPSLNNALREALEAQYRAHRGWTYQLHFDNLRVLVRLNAKLGPMPSYSTLRRYMKSHALVRSTRRDGKDTPGRRLGQQRLELREVRSFESEYVNGLWHLDFHHGSHKILTSGGEWVRPLLLAVLDDHSRLVCHAQWYLSETAEDLVHGLCQAFLKRGLPRALLTDNGSAMLAAETQQGLLRLGIVHETTLPYSPYQNGKQESFWGQVEGRLLAMLDNCRDLTLEFLNEATQAWVEMEYQRKIHSETNQTPLHRFLESPNVSRECPSGDELRVAFCTETSRSQRLSDGTISLEGIRFEVPGRYRHLLRIRVRYASWDLVHVYMVDERRGTLLARLYPQDKARNADGRRRSLKAMDSDPVVQTEPVAERGMAPLLRKLMEDYAATGLPPAYIPKTTVEEDS
jgi:transposase InsO family protein